MKSPGIIDGIFIAAMIALAAGLASMLLGGLIIFTSLLNLILCGSTLVYLIYLLRRSDARVGRIVVFSAWALISLSCWIFDVALFEQVLIQAGLIWLVRSLYFHTTLFTALLDFGLVSVGLAAGTWAMVNTGSLAAAIWSFFLIQALFSWLPTLARQQSAIDSADVDQYQSSFQSAHRVAADAVRKLAQS